MRGRVGGGVVDGVDGEEEIAGGEVVVEARGAEVFADVLRGDGEGLGDAGGEFRPVLIEPELGSRGATGAAG